MNALILFLSLISSAHADTIFHGSGSGCNTNVIVDIGANTQNSSSTFNSYSQWNGSSITLTGSNGYILSGSSIIASAFFGDGSNLSGITASNVPNTFGSSITIKGELLVVNSTITLNGSGGNIVSGGNVTALKYFGDGSALTGIVSGGSQNTFSSSITVNSGGYFTFNGSSITMNGSNGYIRTASSVTASGFFGDGAQLANVAAVSVPAAGVQSGTLGSSVVASSVAATGVTPASYGSASQTISETVGVDGRLSAVSAQSIAIAESQVTGLTTDLASKLSTGTSAANISVTLTGASGSLTTGSSVTASAFFGDGNNVTNIKSSNISAGTLGTSVVASSVAATGVVPGSYGSATQVPGYTIGIDGRLSAASNTSIQIAESQVTGLTTDLAAKASSGTNTDLTRLSAAGGVAVPTFSSSITVNGAFLNNSSATASAFFGDGNNLTNLKASSVASGILGSAVIASSVAASGVAPAIYGSATQVPQVAIAVDGRVTSATLVTISGVVASSYTASVNGSMRGDGTTGAPLGVLSSSVAVLSGGLVLNNQIDSSSVTKQGQVVPVTGGGTGATTASAARTNLSAAQSTINNDITTLQQPVTMTSTLTVTANAFSVGGSTFAIVGGSVGINTTNPQALLDIEGSFMFGPSSGTAGGSLYLATSTLLQVGSLTPTTESGVTIYSTRALANQPAFTVKQANAGNANILQINNSGRVFIGTGASISTFAATGDVTIPTSLMVAGGINISAGNIFQIGGGTFAVTSSGHIKTSGTVPTLTSCGTGTINSNSNDNRGAITFAGGAQTSCVINFINTGGVATPFCTCSISNGTSVAVGCAPGSGTLTISIAVAANDTFNYICDW